MADGTITEELEPVADADGEVQPLVPVNGSIGTECISVQPGQRPRTSDAQAVTVDLATSEGIVTFTGTPDGFSADGCTAISMADPSELMIDGTLVDLSLDRVFAVSPDHTQVIGAVLSDGAQVYLVDVASGERTELPQGSYVWTRV